MNEYLENGCLGINHNYNFIWLTHIYESKGIAMLLVFILNVNTFNHQEKIKKQKSIFLLLKALFGIWHNVKKLKEPKFEQVYSWRKNVKGKSFAGGIINRKSDFKKINNTFDFLLEVTYHNSILFIMSLFCFST